MPQQRPGVNRIETKAHLSTMGMLQTVISKPEEVAPLVQMAWAAHKAKNLPKDANLAFCYNMLFRVGRR